MRQIRLKDSPITYYISESGHREWCLFLHAAFVHHGMFRAQTEYFASAYNILTADIIGHGRSTDTKRGESIEDMSLWIRRIMEAEKIDSIHIVGVSLGAVLAQDFANRYPDAVRSLACFGGYDINHFDRSMQKENGASQMRMMLKAMVSIRWFAQANRKISAVTPQAQQEFYEMNLQFQKKSLRYLATLGRMVNVHETAPRHYPLLIGCGASDIPMARSAVEAWKAREPQAEVVIFENAGHCVNMDAPQKFREALERFWSSGCGKTVYEEGNERKKV